MCIPLIYGRLMIPQNYPTKYWHKLENGRIQCDLCPQACKLNEGQRGICFVRMREKDQIVLTTYGRASGFAIDPIEKKPLSHFLPGTTAYSFGTAGCNMRCKFCQNWHLSKAKSDSVLSKTSSPEEIARHAKGYGCSSVAFTYNEPIISMEYCVDVAKECHKLGIKTVAVTNGYICDEPRKEFFSHMDAANVDLKGFTERFYKEITGSHLQPVLDTLVYLKKHTDVWLEITTLLIPDENESISEIDLLTKWIVENLSVDVPLHFSAFHPAWQMMDKPRTSLETIVKARDKAMENGLRYVYTGNVHYPDGGKTFCYNCGKCVIARGGHSVSEYNLDDKGCCKFCGTKCDGVFV